MKIIVIGGGQVGGTLVGQLSQENHDITLIDIDMHKVRKLTEEYDVMGVCGSGISVKTLEEAGVPDADIVIAVTETDEVNLLCAVMAKKISDAHTIARVRNPILSGETEFIRKQLGISMIINPDLATAREIRQLIKYPSAISIDSFAGGLVYLIKLKLRKDCVIDGVQIKDISSKTGCEMLVCAVERGENVIIPYGSTCLMAGDNISVIVDKSKIKDTLKKLGYEHREVKNVMIVGGKRIGYYTAEALDREGLNVKIIENNRERCEELDELLPHVTIINGDATDKQLLSAEGIKNADAFIAATGIDEENIFLTMFAREMSDAKCVSKVDRLAFDNILDKLDIDSVVYPNFITADYIMQYVRSIQNFAGNSVATLYRLIGNKVEALEFNVHENSPVINKPLRELELKKDLLVCSINRGGKVIVPGGNDCIEKGDSVVIVTLQTGLSDVRDILRD